MLNVCLALVAIIMADRRGRQHRSRLKRAACVTYRAMPNTPQETRKPRSSQITFLGHVFAGVEAQIAQTGLRLSVGELLTQMSLVMLGVYAVLVLFAGMPALLAMPLSIAIPLAGAILLLRIARSKYRSAFSAELPEALDVFARGLRAGRPVADSIAIVVESSKGPIKREFARCHDELHMGTDLSTSLKRLSRRVPTPEVCFFAVATALQAEAGGNLIETMENLAFQLRERRKLRKKARALSSEARASAVILAALPFAVAMVIAVLNGAYLEPLYADPRGRVMAIIATTSIFIGIFTMARMGKLDV
ncbi:type II secretion system F family protein [Flavimaricola marinus]|uniref:type II secretion system F family protein n=1 Tax=Flavimaricola marinus TaxID=1819565 RepID=UPI001454FA21|nr:type II secretion system F family protein [Flavimaricola marinus]